MLYGNIVFSGRACAVLNEYNKGQSKQSPHIVFVQALTTEVAFYVLENMVCGVISEESSFATHGANILRCKLNNSKQNIAWVSGINRIDLVDLFGEKIIITPEGVISAFSAQGCTNRSDANNEYQEVASYAPLPKRSILAYNISENSSLICYWPHRQFNLLTFSIMKEGLRKNLCRFGIKQPYILTDDNGNIWFKNAPLLSELSEFAKDIDKATPLLLEQIRVYYNLHVQLQTDFTFSHLIEMLIEYFSRFLLFHDTYEDVLLTAYILFKDHLGAPITYQIMNLLLYCKIDEWMLNNHIVLEKRKNLLSNEKVVPLPRFSITSDIESSIKRLHDFFVSSGLKDFWISNKNVIEFYIKLFVAKEWKFVMNKILFTRFSYKIRKLLPQYSFLDISTKTIVEVLNLIKETQDGTSNHKCIIIV